jgi:hypothetical protein
MEVLVVFVETANFSRKMASLLADDEYSSVQLKLIKNPTAGTLIQEGGGLRKLRWRAQGKGKSGGVRLIYYFYTPADKIYMLYVFSKSEQEDLSKPQLKALAQIVKGGVL